MAFIKHYIPFYKRNLHLAFPIILAQLGQMTVALVDNMMVGHVGTTELAAAAFANSVFIIGMIFGMGITFGLTPLVGTAFGKKEFETATVWLKNGIFTHLIAGFTLTGLMFATYFFLPIMGQTDNVWRMAQPYYLLLCLSYIPFLLFFSMKQFFEGIGNTRMAMMITLTANVVNIVGNYLFIFGKFGFPELGLVGAGIGTLMARLIMPLLFIFLILRKPEFRQYFQRAHHQPVTIEKIIQILKIGIPIGLQLIVEVMAFTIGAIMMGWLGEIALAAHQVAIGLASTTYMVSVGISQANTIRVSHQIGVRDYQSMKTAALASTHLVLGFMSLMGLSFILARKVLPYIFTTDVAVVEIAAGLLIVAAIFQIFDGLQVVMLSTLRGMADVTKPMIIAFVAYLAIGLPVSYGFAFLLHFGPMGIWFGYLVGLGTAGVLFYLRFRSNLRKKFID